jgi:hypothetical protein
MLSADQPMDARRSDDYGLGPGVIEWRRGCLVRLPEDYRKCAVIIGAGLPGSDDEIIPWGAGFLVDVDVKNPEAKYLVTAAHVVADKRKVPVDIRFNKRGGGARNHYVDEPAWVSHPTDNTVDVAVLRIDVPDWADCTLVPRFPTILENDRFQAKNIGAGNRTYTVGLWKFLLGDNRNQPFVFTGHIGLVPEDQKVAVEAWPPHAGTHVLVDAYLVEGEPLDGASGSPVFVRRTLPHPMPKGGDKAPLEGWIEGSVWLLGLQSNAWFDPPDQRYKMPPGSEGYIVPRGVNAVIPSMKINEVLDHPDLVTAREAAIQRKRVRELPRKTQ